MTDLTPALLKPENFADKPAPETVKSEGIIVEGKAVSGVGDERITNITVSEPPKKKRRKKVEAEKQS